MLTTISVYGKPVLVRYLDLAGFETIASGDTSREHEQEHGTDLAAGEHGTGNSSESYGAGDFERESEGDFDTFTDSDTGTAGERASPLHAHTLAVAAPATSAPAAAQPTRRICAMCGKSLNALTKRQGSRYCSPNCKAKARYQRKKAGLHNNDD